MSESTIHLWPADRSFGVAVCRVGSFIYAFDPAAKATVLGIRRYPNLKAMLEAEEKRLLVQLQEVLTTPEQLLATARKIWCGLHADENLETIALEIGPFVRLPREKFEADLQQHGYDVEALREHFATL